MRIREFVAKTLVITTGTILGLLSLFQSGVSAELTATANHDHINIDFFYHGSAVSIRGTSDPATDLVIKITSPDGHQALRKKGKVAGFLWMNVGTLRFEHAPALYYLDSTRKIEDVLSREEMLKYTIGYEALQRHVDMEPAVDENEKAKWFQEFVRFKESSKLYSRSSGNIARTEKDGKQNYYILNEWPYQAPPGRYTVTVYAVKDKKVIETAEASVLVEQVGIVKSLAGMAKNNGSLYGMISILAALGAGFGVGMVFRKGGGAH
ncbi:MAG TPA: TIGR02186 family protein [Thermodesulfovibrionales bacterium]|nr:TIGR02186 family protein [Thermodesulfovibrionales bacterium]